MRGEIKPKSRIIFRWLNRHLQYGLAEFFSAKAQNSAAAAKFGGSGV